jgi:hypothetical protein
MRYPYSPLGDKKDFLYRETMSGIRFPSSNDIDPYSRGHLEARDMNAPAITEIERPHEYVRGLLQPSLLEVSLYPYSRMLAFVDSEMMYLWGEGERCVMRAAIWLELPAATRRTTTNPLVRV